MKLTRRETLKTVAAVPLAGLALLETGCTDESSVVELLITGLSGIADIVDPQYATLINTYATEGTNFVDFYVAERASGDTIAVQAAKIEAAAAMVVLPNLSGVPADIVTRLNAIAPLIATLVDSIKALSAELEKTPGGANAFFASHSKMKPMTAKQRAKISAKLAALRSKLRSVR
jgi:hypothetical protein